MSDVENVDPSVPDPVPTPEVPSEPTVEVASAPAAEAAPLPPLWGMDTPAPSAEPVPPLPAPTEPSGVEPAGVEPVPAPSEDQEPSGEPVSGTTDSIATSPEDEPEEPAQAEVADWSGDALSESGMGAAPPQGGVWSEAASAFVDDRGRAIGVPWGEHEVPPRESSE